MVAFWISLFAVPDTTDRWTARDSPIPRWFVEIRTSSLASLPTGRRHRFVVVATSVTDRHTHCAHLAARLFDSDRRTTSRFGEIPADIEVADIEVAGIVDESSQTRVQVAAGIDAICISGVRLRARGNADDDGDLDAGTTLR